MEIMLDQLFNEIHIVIYSFLDYNDALSLSLVSTKFKNNMERYLKYNHSDNKYYKYNFYRLLYYLKNNVVNITNINTKIYTQFCKMGYNKKEKQLFIQKNITAYSNNYLKINIQKRFTKINNIEFDMSTFESMELSWGRQIIKIYKNEDNHLCISDEITSDEIFSTAKYKTIEKVNEDNQHVSEQIKIIKIINTLFENYYSHTYCKYCNNSDVFIIDMFNRVVHSLFYQTNLVYLY